MARVRSRADWRPGFAADDHLVERGVRIGRGLEVADAAVILKLLVVRR